MIEDLLEDNKVYHKSIVVVPHFDDEVFQAIAFLLNYKHDIQLFITHPSDCISQEAYEHQSELFETCIGIINTYRSKKGYDKITPHVNPNSNFNGYMDSRDRKELQNRLEGCFRWESYNKIADRLVVDYFITTKISTHQSHQECNRIAMSVMRSPYIECCNKILLATYPQDVYGISLDNGELDTFISITEEQVDLAVDLIGNVYGEKNIEGSILGASKFKEMLKHFGNASNYYEYAQPFRSIKNLIEL